MWLRVYKRGKIVELKKAYIPVKLVTFLLNIRKPSTDVGTEILVAFLSFCEKILGGYYKLRFCSFLTSCPKRYFSPIIIHFLYLNGPEIVVN
jgi:hypothetical protein